MKLNTRHYRVAVKLPLRMGHVGGGWEGEGKGEDNEHLLSKVTKL